MLSEEYLTRNSIQRRKNNIENIVSKDYLFQKFINYKFN